MKSHWRQLAALLPLSLEKTIYSRYFKHADIEWQAVGKKSPPSHLVKQMQIRSLANKYRINVLVETGTYLGDMVFAMQDSFEKIYSIELSPFYYQKAKQRFRKYNHINILEGDSGQILSALVPELKQPSLFWLDGHYSGGKTAMGEKECPVFEELKSIFSSTLNHIIAIDDARLFIGQNDYPTIDELHAFVNKITLGKDISIQNDAIIITPK